MKFRALKSFTFLFILSFLVANVSGGGFTGFGAAFESIFKSKTPSSITSRIAKFKNKPMLDKVKSVKEKVDKLNDVADIVDYLDKYGYSDSSSSNPNSIDKSSLIEFQNFFSLPPTGQFDKSTYNILTKPRCGVADIVKKTTPFKPWWTGTELKYGFHPKNHVADNVKSLFQDAFSRWSKVTALNFIETASFDGSDIRIAFLNIDGKGGVVGVTKQGYMFFDLKEQWELSGKSVVLKEGYVDFESIVMHQIGHVLGLEHSSVEEAVMYPIVLPKQKIELVNDDDLHKIQKIYKN